jgi:Ca2+-binding EF-hand superfamily protein
VLEKDLKKRFQNTWTSVRRAFLDLDVDHDGLVGAEDLIRHFSQASSNLDINDMIKLMS